MFARIFPVLVAVLCIFGTTVFAQPQSAEPFTVILFENVRIFDGKSGTLSAAHERARSREHDRENLGRPNPCRSIANTKIIAGGGRTLMPGLIDMHWHTMLVRPTPAALLAADIGYLNLVAGAEATDTLHARLHHRSRSGRAGVRAQARHRRGHRRRSAHLPVRRHYHDHQWSRRLPPAVRSAARPRRPAVPRWSRPAQP